MKYIRFIFILVLGFALTNSSIAQTNDEVIVMLDPGHGGKDPGNEKNHKKMLDEKDLNLKIALKTGNYIETKLKGVKVIYTRKTDIYLSPQERAELANEKKADYFVSIHCNSSPDKKINGTEIHVHTDRCKESIQMANAINKEFVDRAKLKSRGIKNFNDRNNSNILVVRDTDMPAVLIECGFMSNRAEEKNLNSEYGQSIIASAIYRAIRDFAKLEITPTCNPVYKVQIKASVSKISINSNEFKNVKQKIEEQQMPPKSTFKYKYFIGHFCTFEEANQLKNEIRTKGFEDAFVVQHKE